MSTLCESLVCCKLSPPPVSLVFPKGYFQGHGNVTHNLKQTGTLDVDLHDYVSKTGEAWARR